MDEREQGWTDPAPLDHAAKIRIGEMEKLRMAAEANQKSTEPRMTTVQDILIRRVNDARQAAYQIKDYERIMVLIDKNPEVMELLQLLRLHRLF